MNRGLLLKAWRETWPNTALFAAIVCVVEAGLGYLLPHFGGQLAEQWMHLPFIQNLIRALVGADMSEGIGPDLFRSLPWVHPVVLALIWGHAIVQCTRVPAGEVDRGTIDVLLGLPVSRWAVHRAETVNGVVSGGIVIGAAVLGNGAGGFFLDSPWTPGRVAIVAINLWLLYASVGAIAWLMAACSDRRGRAIGGASLFVAAAFLVNYLSKFWSPIFEPLSYLSVVRYYRPLFALRGGPWPLQDMAVLVVIAVAAWASAGWVFAHRDLATT